MVNGGTDECKASATVVIRVRAKIKIPRAFTPNGDQENDSWEIGGLGTFENASVRIYNRWGSLVWEKGGGYNGDFRGQSKGGGDLAVGTYYYVIDTGDDEIQGIDKLYSGYVMIIR
jgi:gliding motility-associated-like protein